MEANNALYKQRAQVQEPISAFVASQHSQCHEQKPTNLSRPQVTFPCMISMTAYQTQHRQHDIRDELLEASLPVRKHGGCPRLRQSKAPCLTRCRSKDKQSDMKLVEAYWHSQVYPLSSGDERSCYRSSGFAKVLGA
jgi:hypothetical protein